MSGLAQLTPELVTQDEPAPGCSYWLNVGAGQQCLARAEWMVIVQCPPHGTRAAYVCHAHHLELRNGAVPCATCSPVRTLTLLRAESLS